MNLTERNQAIAKEAAREAIRGRYSIGPDGTEDRESRLTDIIADAIQKAMADEGQPQPPDEEPLKEFEFPFKPCVVIDGTQIRLALGYVGGFVVYHHSLGLLRHYKAGVYSIDEEQCRQRGFAWPHWWINAFDKKTEPAIRPGDLEAHNNPWADWHDKAVERIASLEKINDQLIDRVNTFEKIFEVFGCKSWDDIILIWQQVGQAMGLSVEAKLEPATVDIPDQPRYLAPLASKNPQELVFVKRFGEWDIWRVKITPASVSVHKAVRTNEHHNEDYISSCRDEDAPKDLADELERLDVLARNT